MGRCLIVEDFKWRARRFFAPLDQLDWDLQCGVVLSNLSHKFEHRPRAPGIYVLSQQVVGPQCSDNRNHYIHQPHRAIPKGHRTHHPVIVSPTPGSRMAPTRGFYPSIPSHQQSYERAHLVERNGIRELY